MRTDDLIAQLSADTANGTLSLDADGRFVYTPNAGFVGIDAFETSDPILIRAFETGVWPEVPHYLQPAFDEGKTLPAGTRPWIRKKVE